MYVIELVFDICICIDSRKPREASLCQDLIILLSLGDVPADFFERLVRNALEKIKNVFTDWDLAFEGT
jgi:hypothetical protein